MNNNITDDYCSFEVSKLLKDKGFNIWCYSGWNDNKVVTTFKSSSIEIYKPTHALAIKWIRENFGYHIEIGFYAWSTEKYDFRICRKGHKDFDFDSEGTYDSYSDATEAALLYALQNLI